MLFLRQGLSLSHFMGEEVEAQGQLESGELPNSTVCSHPWTPIGGCISLKERFSWGYLHEVKNHPEAHITLKQLKTPGVSVLGGMLHGPAVLCHQNLQSLLHLGLMSSAPNRLMTNCSQGNYSAWETCPRSPAQGNSRAGDISGKNKKDRVRLPALGNGMVCAGNGAWGMENSILLRQFHFLNLKNTEKHKIKHRNYPVSSFKIMPSKVISRGAHCGGFDTPPFWIWPLLLLMHIYCFHEWKHVIHFSLQPAYVT